MDDILVYSPSIDSHVELLTQVFDIITEHQFYIKLSKCSFAKHEIEYLGHIITKEGVATDPTKFQIIKDWQAPSTITQVRAFLGLTGYYRRLIKDYGIICRPLYDSLRKDDFQWIDRQTQTFQSLKQAMLSPPVLALLDFSKPFILEADASGHGIGAVLMQGGKPIAFF